MSVRCAVRHASGSRSRAGAGRPGQGGGDAQDPSYREAVRVVLSAGKGSVSLIQRKLKLGYGRAARLLDLMAEAGVVGPPQGSKAREVKTTLEAWARGSSDEA